MPSEQITFRNSLGLNLYSVLNIPVQVSEPIPAVIFVHGRNNSSESLFIEAASRALLDRGLASLLLDFTGHGKSEGSLSDSTITQQVDDLENAISSLRADGRFNPIGVYGETTAGTVAMRVAVADKSIGALVLQAPRADADTNLPRRITIPTLIVQGSADLEVRPESREIYDQLGGKKYLHIIAGAGHMFDETPKYLEEAVNVAASWLADNLWRARSIGA